MFWKRKKDNKVRAELMQRIHDAINRGGRCVILGKSEHGTRVIVLGQPLYRTQVEEILKEKGL